MLEIIKDLDLNIEDIPSEHMQMVADRCGVSDAISLMTHVPGLELYIPASGKKAIDKNYIRSTFNGSNTASIAVKLGIDNNKIKKIVKKLSKNDLSDNIFTNEAMMIVARECGEDVAIRLMKQFSICTLYVPINGFSVSIRKYIQRNFTGFNTATLALKCNVSERHVRQVISDMYASKAQYSLDL